MESSEMCGWADDRKESNGFRSCSLTLVLSGAANWGSRGRTALKTGSVLCGRSRVSPGLCLCREAPRDRAVAALELLMPSVPRPLLQTIRSSV